MILSAIVAMSRNWTIGRNNSLPWTLKEDLVRFRKITMNHPILMGRKTFQSIGKLLPGREHFIISRDLHYQVPGAVVTHSIDQAIEVCTHKVNEAFIIGGSEIYRQSLPRIDRLYLTVIHQDFEGDAQFPFIQFDSTHLLKPTPRSDYHFKVSSQEDHLNVPLPYTFYVLDKIREPHIP